MGRPRKHSLCPLGERLQYAIRESQCTQGDFGDAVGVSSSAMAKYLRGESSPRCADVEAWSRHLGVTPEWLAFGLGDSGRRLAAINASSLRIQSARDELRAALAEAESLIESELA